jgi:polyisoprenyl-teichoic acid--peptidoglycan teichoic acid transferase
MPNNHYNPDDPTAPVRPHSSPPPQSPPSQGHSPQGKLVLGGFQNQPAPSQRQPYQNPAPSHQPPVSPPRQQQAAPPWQQQAPVAPPNYANYHAANMSAKPPAARKPRGKGCLITTVVVLVLACIVGSLAVTTTQRVLAFGTKISTQQPLSTQTNYMNISDRTNMIVIGYGGGTHDGANLTDSLLVASVLPQSHHTTLVSIPRDLLVSVPGAPGGVGKINSLYEYTSNFGKDPTTGANAVAAKASKITGLNVKYWMMIDFTGFRDLIDALGGVDVYVPDSFNACYPKNDDAAKDASWIKVQFNKGNQHMDGATAISYARAREPLEVCGKGTSQNLAELTDFGRSARQQIIVKAVLAQVKQVSTWPKFFDAMTALEKAIRTNLSLADLSQFALKMDMNDPKTSRIGLSNQNVLVDDESFNLVPRNNDWNAVSGYVQQKLYN